MNSMAYPYKPIWDIVKLEDDLNKLNDYCKTLKSELEMMTTEKRSESDEKMMHGLRCLTHYSSL